jgi:hypothetical protein
MTQLELKDFFDNYEHQATFLATNKIYEFTNNLDLYLLIALRKDFRRHYLKKALQLVKDFEAGVSGVKPTTLQPMLNAMLSEIVSDKNNP